MTKRLLQDRICDKCTTQTEAAFTERIGVNGEIFAVDLCQRHSDLLHDQMHAWTALGTSTGTPSRFEARRQHTRPVVVDLEPVLIKAATRTPVGAGSTERRVLPEYPLTAHRWQMTKHASQRMTLRHLSEAQLLRAAEDPQLVLSSLKNPNVELRTRDKITVAVDPNSLDILTCYDADEPEDDTSYFLQQAKA